MEEVAVGARGASVALKVGARENQEVSFHEMMCSLYVAVRTAKQLGGK